MLVKTISILFCLLTVIDVNRCLLLTKNSRRNKHAHLHPKLNQFDNLNQALDYIKSDLDTFQINENELALMVHTLNMIDWERKRKQTVYWYLRQG